MSNDAEWLDVAAAVAKHAKCTRRQVGAVLVRNGRLLASGRNGTPAGEPNCTEGGCPRGLHYKHTEIMVDQLEKPVFYFCACGKRWPCSDSAEDFKNYEGSQCCHAEMNVLLYASREQTEGAEIYCTCKPCDDCFKYMRAAGISRIKTPDFEWKRP